jgi:site-specific recombinase XerC
LRGFFAPGYGEASVQTFTVGAVAAWCDHLQAHGLAPSSVAQRVSAVRGLAAAVGADPLVAQARCSEVQPHCRSALSELELSGLLAGPDLRSTIGVRDRAILELLARGALSSVCAARRSRPWRGRVAAAGAGSRRTRRFSRSAAPSAAIIGGVPPSLASTPVCGSERLARGFPDVTMSSMRMAPPPLGLSVPVMR